MLAETISSSSAPAASSIESARRVPEVNWSWSRSTCSVALDAGCDAFGRMQAALQGLQLGEGLRDRNAGFERSHHLAPTALGLGR